MLGRRVLLAALCGACATQPLLHFHPQFLEPACSDIGCMPHPAVSAYWRPWSDASLNATLSRFNESAMLRRYRNRAAQTPEPC